MLKDWEMALLDRKAKEEARRKELEASHNDVTVVYTICEPWDSAAPILSAETVSKVTKLQILAGHRYSKAEVGKTVFLTAHAAWANYIARIERRSEDARAMVERCAARLLVADREIAKVAIADGDKDREDARRNA